MKRFGQFDHARINQATCCGMLCLLGLALMFAEHAGAAGLQAGAARVEITTPADALPYGAASSSPGNEKPFVGMHDPVFARALVLSDGATEVAFVLVDVTAIPVPHEMSKAVANELGVAEDHLMLAAEHTHSVPLLNYHRDPADKAEVAEVERVEKGAVEAAREAKANLQPARVSFGRGQAFVNVNNGEVAGQAGDADPALPSDKTLDIVRFAGADGTAIAVLMDYPDHADVMLHSVTKDGGYEISGDMPGVAAGLLEDHIQGKPVVLFARGAGGDQLPLFRSVQPAGALGTTDEAAGGWALLDAQARRLAGSALSVIEKMPAGTADVKISAAAKTVPCPAQARGNQPGDAPLPPVQIPLSLIRINDIALAGVGGDVGTEIGEKFKAASPVKDSTMITMTSGSVGYILADSSYTHPGHGLMGSPIKAGCAEKAIVEGLLSMMGNEK